MKEILKKIFGTEKRTWRCNVINCPNNVSFSGEICGICKNKSIKFKEEQKRLDERFKKYIDTKYLGDLFMILIPESKHTEEIWQVFKRELHERDERIQEMFEKNINYNL